MTIKNFAKHFPMLRRLRKAQRKWCFYAKMRFDGNHYAVLRSCEMLPYPIFEMKCLLLNEDTGFDMQYQQNKAYNLRIAAKTLDMIRINPGETFSFWKLVKNADKYTPYKDGLCLIDGAIKPSNGGGLCQMSNTLFWIFLHTPLTILERHTHTVRDFPYPKGDVPEGADATVAQGLTDLKLRNDTDITFEIHLSFDERYMYAAVFANKPKEYECRIVQRDLRYIKYGAKIYERVTIVRQQIDPITHEVALETVLYENKCEINYKLPDDMPIYMQEE
ncbi:MAG: glycopeptide resistance accessory protein VanW [Clostridia bacterium]